MNPIIKSIRRKLSLNSNISTNVSGRIYDTMRSQESALPAIIYVVIAGENEPSTSGNTTLQRARVQIDAFDSDLSDCWDLFGDIRDTMDGLSDYTFSSVTIHSSRLVNYREDHYSPTDGGEALTFRITSDYRILFTED